MDLVVIVGPLAVGKMTVGMALAERTGYRLFHNHMTVEPLVGIFPFGSEPYVRLVKAFRSMIISEAVTSGLPGMIITFVMDFDDPGDAAFLAEVIQPVVDGGGRIDFLELTADQQTRLAREGTELRMINKATKRDVAVSRDLLRRVDAEHRLNSDGDFPFTGRHLLIDNSHLEPTEVAERVITAWDLPDAR